MCADAYHHRMGTDVITASESIQRNIENHAVGKKQRECVKERHGGSEKCALFTYRGLKSTLFKPLYVNEAHFFLFERVLFHCVARVCVSIETMELTRINRILRALSCSYVCLFETWRC